MSLKLENEISYIKDRLECIKFCLENPTYNALEVGFRHTTLSDKEIIERYKTECQVAVNELSHILAILEECNINDK